MFWGLGKRRDVLEPDPPLYKAYTTEFDREVDASDLAQRLASRREKATTQALLDALQEPTRSRLAAVQRSIAFQARYRAGHDLGERPCFTLLVDHSGSMKGPKAMAAAICADVVGGILEHERRPIEVLGFTTRSWKGGNARSKWVRKGVPKAPGRLCDLLHIVYLDAARPQIGWARNLVLMLDPDVLKENVDGEALLWARRRIEALDPTGWVCVIISDGVPMDDSTVDANGGEPDGWYLDRHLASVVDEFNRAPRIRLGCLALDHTPKAPFRVVEQVDTLEAAPTQLFDLMEMLIWPSAAAK